MADRVRLETDGDVGIIVLDDPPLNLFGRELVDDLMTTIEEAHAAPIRALIVRAEGEVFTGGADVNAFDGLSTEAGDEFFMRLIAVTQRLEDLALPTLASVHGLCLTAGFELSLACDMTWADQSARFGLVEQVVGITPGMGGTQRLVERAGPARAREFVMSGALYDAATLERWNVINRVLPDDELEAKSLKFARKLAAGPTLAHAATKRIVRAAIDEGVRGADARVGEIVAPLFETEDAQGAIASFLRDGPGKATFEGK